MTDTPIPPTIPPATDSQSVPATAPGQSNPLDALEAILQQAKSKSAGGEDPAKVPAAAAGKPDAAALAAIEAQQQAELAAMETTAKAKDEAQVQAELADLQQVSQSPEYKARVEQDAAQQQIQTAQKQNQDEFEIRQLGHTKI